MEEHERIIEEHVGRMEEHERRMLAMVAQGELFQACVDRAVGFGWRRFTRNWRGPSNTKTDVKFHIVGNYGVGGVLVIWLGGVLGLIFDHLGQF